MVAGVGDVGALVVTLCGCVVDERVGVSGLYGVVFGVLPDLVEVQDAVVAVIPAGRPSYSSAEHRVTDGHIREREVAGVGDGEGIGDILAGLGRARTRLDESDPGCEVEGQGVWVCV